MTDSDQQETTSTEAGKPRLQQRILAILPPALAQNPIVAHSLSSRKWNWRMAAALVLALFTYCPALLILSPYVIASLFDSGSAFFNGWDEVGITIFNVSAIFLLILITLFAPTMSASAIAGEKQRQTLDLLLVTLLPARSIILGKLVTALIYTLLLIAIVWPLILFALIMGQVDILQFLVLSLLLITTAIAFTIIGLYGSSLGRTTTNAVMLTYGLIMPAFLIGPFLAMLPVTILLNLSDVSFRLEETINVYGWSLAASINPLSAAIYSAILRAESNGFILASEPTYLIFPWVIYIIFYSFISWLLLRLTVRRLQREGH